MEKEKIKFLASKYGTPLYIYDAKEINNSFEKLKSVLPENSKIYFSLKSNPLIGICQQLYKKGCKVEVASMGELYIALKSKVGPKDILFTSPGKTIDELEYAIDKNINLINAESFEEIKLINDIGLKKNKIIKIIIRINPDFNNTSSTVKMSGVSSQFGIDESGLTYELFNKIKTMKNIDLCGIQVYMGTQILDCNAIYNNFKEIIVLAKRISKKFGFKLKYLDCGGGFGVKYFPNDKELDLEELKILNKELLLELKDIPDTQLIFESGRFLLANAGIFVTSIKYIKESKGKKYYICDGGMNCFSSAAFLGRFVRNNFPIYSITNSVETEEVNVTGPLCTPTDLIGQNIIINKAEINDIIIIDKAGAYGLTYSPILFLSHNSPREIIVDGDKEYILREKSSFEDLVKNQRCLYE